MQKTAYIILFTALLTTTLLVSCKDRVNQPSNEVLTKDKGTSILIEYFRTKRMGNFQT